MTDLTGTTPLGAGLHVAGAQVLTPAMLDYLRRVRVRLTFDLVVTSGQRTATAQARAWAVKIAGHLARGEDPRKALHDLYRRDDLVDEVMDGDTTEAGIAQTIAAQVARGDLLSSHLSGTALDLRIRGLDEGQITGLVAACVAEGGRCVREAVPPHLHVELGASDRRTVARTVTGMR